MATEDFETTCDSYNINSFVGNDSGGGIVDSITGFWGNNGGGDQLAPESTDLNRQLSGCRQACVLESQPRWRLGSRAGSLVTGHDPRSGREGLQLPNGLALGAGNHENPGFNPSPAYSATSIPEVPTGGSLTGNVIHHNWASFYDENLTQPTPSWPSFAIPPVVPEINPLLASHGVAAKSPDGKHPCICGKTFKRSDSRKRHIDGASRRHPSGVIPATIGVQTPAGLLPCMMRNRRRGADGFARRDNLRQHLKGYHKLSKEFIDEYFRTYH